MSSLRQLLHAHPSALVLDAASSRVQVGLLCAGGPWRWSTSDAEAGVALFECVRALDLELDTVSAFIFCEGPGSILGIRTTAMAVRSWCTIRQRPIYRYSSLAAVAHSLGQPDVSVIADARRESWHRFRIAQGLDRVPATELEGRLITPAGFRAWSKAPATVETVRYDLNEILALDEQIDLFQPTDAPDAFLHEDPTYVQWTPQIHRAPSTS